MSDTFKVLYFASATQFTKCDEESFPAPMTLGELFGTLEMKYKGITEKVLRRSMVTVNLDYVEVDEGEGLDRVLRAGDELGVLPPVSAG